MKVDLEILIEHLQKEVDYLKSSMDQCATELDFDGAKTFKESLIYTNRKLNVLKCIKNPNYEKISKLSGMISRMEKSLNESKFNSDNFNEKTRKRMEGRFNQSLKERIKKSQMELDELNAIIPKPRIDDDKILALLEQLETNQLEKAEFEVISEKIYLSLAVNGKIAELKFKTKGDTKIEKYLHRQSKSILKRLGFNLETYSRTINNYQQIEKLAILEELSIITFEVFNLYGDEKMNIKIE